MSVLQGRGSGSGGGSGATPVLATAAILDDTHGRYTLSDEVLSLVARRMRRGDGPLDIVLVAQEASHALLLRLPPEFNLVGVIAEREMGFVPPAEEIAIVSGLGGALSSISDGDWVIVDPTRGRVVINPAAEEIARFQASRYVRPSVLLGAAHTPARTLAGRNIAVWARIDNALDLNAALLHGADGIFVPRGSELLADADSDSPDADEMMFALLAQAADAMGGGDVCLAAGMDALHPRTVVRLAARCRLSWALEPDALPYSVSDLVLEMNALIDQEEDEGEQAALPRLAVIVNAPPDENSLNDSTFIDFNEALWLSDDALPTSQGFLPPIVRVLLSAPEAPPALERAVAQAIAQGASGVIVAPTGIETTKDVIREQEY